MTAEYILERFDTGMHYIALDEKTASAFTQSGNRRVLCTLNEKVELHSAIMQRKDGGYFINIGLATCKKLKIKAGSTLTASFSPDGSAYQFEMPDELREVLDTDERAAKIFRNLTDGNQRGLMYLVAQVKSTDRRIERALRIAEKIKHGIISPKDMLRK
jgi:uncharacterized protein YdeI (YjbR/CyaY-like superfamily)